mmetsp:Transcript_55363/g.154202  ORF Transcript_55363/g.154202 Transcript_55363/m.154202 type:complete len:328 (+) Transcript_55363:265-1248(+)
MRGVPLEVAHARDVELAPLLRLVFRPQSNIQKVLVFQAMHHMQPEPLGRSRAVVARVTEREGGPLRQEWQRLVRPSWVRVAPARGPNGDAVSLRIRAPLPSVVRRITAHVAALWVPRHPMHWQDGEGVRGAPLLARTPKHVVRAIVYPLVSVEDDSSPHLREEHCLELVEIERLAQGHVAALHEHHPRKTLRSPFLRQVRAEIGHDNRPVREVVNGLHKQVHLSRQPGKILPAKADIRHKGFIHPTRRRHEVSVVAFELGVDEKFHLPSQARTAEVLYCSSQIRLVAGRAVAFCCISSVACARSEGFRAVVPWTGPWSYGELRKFQV